MSDNRNNICAIADPVALELLARVALEASPERVFRALTSSEIAQWWARPGVFDTTAWSGDVRVGGRWHTSGTFRGQPYSQQGEFLEVEAPRRLVHTTEGPGKPGAPCRITYTLEPHEGGTRLLLRQSGFATPERCQSFALGWESSFEQLAEMLTPELAANR